MTHAWKRLSNRWILGAVAILALSGCGTEDTAPDPNTPPETVITGGPLEGGRVPHHVELLWFGADADGPRPNFEYILETYPTTVTQYAQIQVQTPAPDDPRWLRTTATRQTFVLPADALRGARTDPAPQFFERWHTFFVRAVDVDGGIDTTPDARTFQVFTEAPSLSITAPVAETGITTLPRTCVMHWTGTDPIGGFGDFQDPASARWVLLPAVLDVMGRPRGFPDTLYALAESRWSPFEAWDTTDGRTAVLRDLVPQGPALQAYVFAVQGKDDGGAITPNFDGTNVLTRNYVAFIADGALDAGPRLTIFVAHTQVDTIVTPGGNPPAYNIITHSDSVGVNWTQPDATHYGGQGREARYGWNITDVTDDAQWTAWSVTSRSAPKRRLLAGDVFFLQGRDDTGRGNHTLDQVTTARIALQHLLQ